MDILGVKNVQASLEEYKASVDIKPVESKNKNQSLLSTKDDKKQKVSEEVKKNLEELNSVLKTRDAKAVISTHEVFGDTMIKIIDEKTHEVILETPPEKILDMIAKLCEIAGVNLDAKA